MTAVTKHIRQAGVVSALAYSLAAVAARPWMELWGSTGEERSRGFLGDELANQQTHAITIDSTPEEVWPWLVQLEPLSSALPDWRGRETIALARGPTGGRGRSQPTSRSGSNQ